MLKDLLGKLVDLVKGHLVTARVLLALSAVQLAYSLALSLLFNHNFGLYLSLAGVLLAAPKNVLAALVIKRLFLPDPAQQ